MPKISDNFLTIVFGIIVLGMVLASLERADAQRLAALIPGVTSAERYTVDTEVRAVRVSPQRSVAIMGESAASPCRSDRYYYERAREKWLYQTGRLLQAAKERAPLRISFSCVNGEQRINAIQFLTLVDRVPGQADDSAAFGGPVPLPPPAGAGASVMERLRALPRP